MVSILDFRIPIGLDSRMTDEGPSLEDLRRFGGDTAFCPECGEEIWDQAEFCPKCRSYLAGDVSPKHPQAREFQKKFLTLIAIIVLIGFLLLFVF